MTTTTLPSTDVINTSQLRQIMNEDPDLRILDVRTGGEFETVHIPGSYNVPLDTLGEHVRDLADVEHPVVLVCQSGGRATPGPRPAHCGGQGDAAHPRGRHGRLAGRRRRRRARRHRTLGHGPPGPPRRRLAWCSASIAASAGGAEGEVARRRSRRRALTYSAVSNTCAMGDVLAKLPYNQTDNCDIVGVLDDLNRKVA